MENQLDTIPFGQIDGTYCALKPGLQILVLQKALKKKSRPRGVEKQRNMKGER